MIKFNKIRIPTILLSIILILIGIWFFVGINPFNINLGYFTPKGFNLGIDFQGGLVHQVTVYSGIEQEEIRQMAIDAGLGKEVQEVKIPQKNKIGKEASYLIKVLITKEEDQIIEKDPDMTPSKFLSEKMAALYKAIIEKKGEFYTLEGEELANANRISKDLLTGEIEDQRTDNKRVLYNVVKESETVISPVYSGTLRKQVIFLIVFVLIVMLLYITFRFKFKYGIGAVAALIHDVLIILGFVSITRLEFDYTIIAAILFIIGYSLNDTIVIFDRIRENFGIMKDARPVDITNISVNQSLSRTIITSLTTLLAVIALLVWGGPKIQGFAITLVVGIISGTYSSIFIASPVVDSWDLLFADKKTRIKKLKKEEKIKVSNEEDKVSIEGKTSDKNIDNSAKQEKIVLSKKQLKKISGKKKKSKK